MSLSIATVGDLRYALGEHNLAQLRIGERQATYGALVELKTDLGLVQRIFERSD